MLATTLPVAATASAPPCAGRGSRSVVQAIRDEFREIATCADDIEAAAAFVSAEDIARYWERLADTELYASGRSISALGSRGKQAIALRVAQLMQDMDLMKAGEVGIDEWVHYMLLARSGFAARQVNVLLDRALQKNRSILHELQRMFDAADITKSGVLSFAEIVSMYSRKLWHLRPSRTGPAKPLTEEELVEGSPEEFAREVIQAMDINGDERVSYPEFMAYSLGRRKHEVLLHLYDLSNGTAKNISPWLLGRELEGVWHTGVVVYGKEYYYSKDTVYADAGDTSFGQPTRIVHLGYTLWRQDELHEFVTMELKPVFQRDTYDVVCNNCNHFSDRVCMFLVGKHPPPEVMQQPELLLRARAIRVLRPILNWWLRDRIVVRETGVALPPGIERLKPGEQPPLGTILTLHAAHSNGPTILAQVAASPERREDNDSEGRTTGMTSPDVGLGFGCSLAPSDSCAPSAGGGFDQSSSCGGLWAGTCGVLRQAAGAQGSAPDGIWVQYFDAPLAGASGRAQVRVESVPHSRLSLGGLRPGDGEEIYQRAYLAIQGTAITSVPPNDSRLAGRGGAAFRVAAPGPVTAHPIAAEKDAHMVALGVSQL